jgi:gluconolactonase
MDLSDPHIRTVVADACYPEGPLCLEGDLLWVEFGRDAVMILSADDARPRTLWSRPGAGPAAVIAGAKDDLWVTGYGCDALIHLSRDGETLAIIERDSDGAALIGPNDLVLDAAGGLYFTASGVFELDAPVEGRILYHRPADGVIIQVAESIHYANGIGLNPAGDLLYVCEHFTNSLLSYRVAPDGTLSERQVLADLTAIAPAPRHDEPKLGPDGMKVLPSGTLLVAQYGGGRLIAVTAEGALAGVVELPLQYCTNVALHPDGDAVIVTAFERDEPPYPGKLLSLSLSLSLLLSLSLSL